MPTVRGGHHIIGVSRNKLAKGCRHNWEKNTIDLIERRERLLKKLELKKNDKLNK